MINQYSRTELLIGSDGLEKLKNSRVAVFGVGGVGGFTVEALARSGVGTIDIIDNDTKAAPISFLECKSSPFANVVAKRFCKPPPIPTSK